MLLIIHLWFRCSCCREFQTNFDFQGSFGKIVSPLYIFFLAIYMCSLTVISWGRILVVQNKLRHILLSKNNDKLCHCTTGETFVTRKITRAVAKIHLGLQDEVNSAFSDKNWGVANLNMLHPLPNKILGNYMQNDGSYLAYTWERYGWVNSYLGNGMLMNVANFGCYEKCMEWKLLFCQDMDKILN